MTAALSLATGSAMWTTDAGSAWADQGTTTVPMRQYLRSCDYSMLQNVGGSADGAATTVIRLGGSSASAEVHLMRGKPGMHYDVGLIQAPRSSSSGCGPGAPGTAYGSLNTDANGVGTVTVQDAIHQGTTGLWVIIQRPGEHSQTPGEFYTSDFILPV